MLEYCNNCKENSVKIKVYTLVKTGIKRRIEYCINKSCLYSKPLPFPEETKGFCTDAHKSIKHKEL